MEPAASWQPLIQTVLLSLIAALNAAFGLWLKYKNDRLERKVDSNTVTTEATHKAVNSTASRLAEEKRRQDQLVKDLMGQIAALRIQKERDKS